MNAAQWRLIAIVAVGGAAVLGSYVHGIATHPETRGLVWGGVPDAARPLYTINMFLAAAGWFTFTSYILFRLPSDSTRVGGRYGWSLFVWLHILVLVGSTLWMPLTFAYLDAPSPALWWAIRGALMVVGLASLGFIFALAAAEPKTSPVWLRLAVLGAVFFTVQTLLLDALIWPAYFPT